MKLKDKQALKNWDALVKSMSKATVVDIDETPAQQQKRVERLKGDFVAFSKYYFPNYCSSEFARFHKRFASKVIRNKKIVITRAMARAMAKSTIVNLLFVSFLKFTGRCKNVLLVSRTQDNAQELLKPMRAALEFNQRIIHDFGTQKGLTFWEAHKFVATDGVSFRAIGSGQNPRGTRDDEARPDLIIIDDIDDDELCRNPKRLDDLWNWVMGALFACFDIVGTKRLIGIGNIIAKDTIIERLSKIADDHEQINLLDKQGRPSWKERHTKADCQYMIDKMGTLLAQREYFNNPLAEGKIFKKDFIQYAKMPPMARVKYLCAYLDPGFKKTKTSDTKSWVLVGMHEGNFYVYKVFCAIASVSEMIAWGYELEQYVRDNGGTAEMAMEVVFLQDLLFDDFKAESKQRGHALPLKGDHRKKPDKDSRITAISGYYERGNVFYNEKERDNHHMIAFEEQHLIFEPGVKTPKDGPDAEEGAIYLLKQRIATDTSGITIGARSRAANKHRL